MARRELAPGGPGGSVTLREGRWCDAVDRFGVRVAEWHWSGDGTLAGGAVRAPDGAWIEIRPRAGHHPILGPVDALVCGPTTALATATDWSAPTFIPAVDRPGALPPGVGTAVLAALAGHARAAGVEALRYRGPYPTVGLWRTLRGCFEPSPDDPARFSADLGDAALTGRAVTPAVDFAPRPPWRAFPGPGVCSEGHGQEIERVWVAGRAHSRGARVHGLLRDDDGGLSAVLRIGGAPPIVRARLSATGDLERGPVPLQAPSGAAVDRHLPEAMRRVIGEFLRDHASSALAPAIAAEWGECGVRFGDAGDAEARAEEGGYVVHAALVDTLEGAQLLGAIAEALQPLVARAALQRLLAEAEAAATR